MKNIIFFLIILLCTHTLYCGGSSRKLYVDVDKRLKIEKENEIKKGKYGYLKIIFPEFRDMVDPVFGKIHEHWYLYLSINNERYFWADFFGGETYTIPVPAGKIEISYDLYNDWEGLEFPPVFYQTNGLLETLQEKKKKIALEIEEFKTVSLKIVKISEPGCGLGCTSCLPIPAYIQDIKFEIVFEVEKVENAKPVDLKNNKSQ